MNTRINGGDAKWHKIGSVQLFARRDSLGRPTKVDAIEEDHDAILAIADDLQRAGYGVFHERSPRAGRVLYRLNAAWAGPGDPPEDPFRGQGR